MTNIYRNKSLNLSARTQAKKTSMIRGAVRNSSSRLGVPAAAVYAYETAVMPWIRDNSTAIFQIRILR